MVDGSSIGHTTRHCRWRGVKRWESRAVGTRSGLCGCSVGGSWAAFREPGTLQEKHFQESAVGPQISPLRYAPVEMTKGREALPGRAVAQGDEKRLLFSNYSLRKRPSPLLSSR